MRYIYPMEYNEVKEKNELLTVQCMNMGKLQPDKVE